MSAHHRGGTGQSDAFYSNFHRPFDIDARKRRPGIASKMLAPMIDCDWRWFDGPATVALIDMKHPGERWTLVGARGNGLQGMANLATVAQVPAFALQVDTFAGVFTFYALNAYATAALMAMHEWCAAAPRRKLTPLTQDATHGRELLTMTVRHRGYWHFEMLTRARFRGEAEHDEAETDRRVRVLYDKVPLPQRPALPIVLEPFAYGPDALAQRKLGAAAVLQPIVFHVAELRELLQVEGRANLIPELDELERRAAIPPADETLEVSNVLPFTGRRWQEYKPHSPYDDWPAEMTRFEQITADIDESLARRWPYLSCTKMYEGLAALTAGASAGATIGTTIGASALAFEVLAGTLLGLSGLLVGVSALERKTSERPAA